VLAGRDISADRLTPVLWLPASAFIAACGVGILATGRRRGRAASTCFSVTSFSRHRTLRCCTGAWHAARASTSCAFRDFPRQARGPGGVLWREWRLVPFGVLPYRDWRRAALFVRQRLRWLAAYTAGKNGHLFPPAFGGAGESRRRCRWRHAHAARENACRKERLQVSVADAACVLIPGLHLSVEACASPGLLWNRVTGVSCAACLGAVGGGAAAAII